MPGDLSFGVLPLLSAAFFGFLIGILLWRALTLRARRQSEAQHAAEIRDLRARWQEAQKELDELRSSKRSQTSTVRTPPDRAALQAPKAKVPDRQDDLQRIKGVGKSLERRLRELGVRSFEQIAAWQDADIERIESQLQSIPGRIRRDRWVEQARKLARSEADDSR